MSRNKTPKYGARQRQQEAKERRYKDAAEKGKGRELTDKEIQQLKKNVIFKKENNE